MTQWVTQDYARLECKTSHAKIRKLRQTGKITSKVSPKDDRVCLIDLDELKRFFEMSAN